MVLFCIYWVDGDLLNSVFANLGGGHRGYGKVDLPKVNITWHMAVAGNRTPVAQFESRIEYHHTTDPQDDPRR